jgi:hypothetical protein
MRNFKTLLLLVSFWIFSYGSMIHHAKATPHQRTGFMLRGTIGIAGLNGGPFISENGSISTVSEVSNTGSLSFGGMVNPQWALHLTLFSLAVVNPDPSQVYAQDEKVLLDPNAQGILNFNSLGIGTTYYIESVGMFLSTSLGMGSTRTTIIDSPYVFYADSKFGISSNFLVGKEWNVNQRWDLGIAGAFYGLWIHCGQGCDQTISTLGGGIVFTATFNKPLKKNNDHHMTHHSNIMSRSNKTRKLNSQKKTQSKKESKENLQKISPPKSQKKLTDTVEQSQKESQTKE